MNDRLVPVRLEDVTRSRLHQVGAGPAESRAETDPRRWLAAGHFTADGARPRGVEASRPPAGERLAADAFCIRALVLYS